MTASSNRGVDVGSGRSIDRYLVGELLGAGGMGRVYRAFDTRLMRPVALKILDPGEGQAPLAMALREAQVCAALRHPGVAEVFDAGDADGAAFIVMELVPGRSLRELVGDPSIAIPVRVGWLADVARAVAHAHERGIVHRDLKPENVIVRDDGVVKVLDFGIARIVRPGGERGTLTSLGALVGTPAYMAPEHARGNPIDGRADQFAWGVVAFELLTGAMPWQRAVGTIGVLAAVLCDAPDSFPAEALVPPEVAAVVLRALSKSREDRFPSMADIADALAPYAAPAASAKMPISTLLDDRANEPLAQAPPPTSRPARAIVVHRTLPSGVAPTAIAALPRRHDPRRFSAPDFAAEVDLEAHLRLLPRGATSKGMLPLSLVEQGTRVVPAAELFARAGVTPCRYHAFRDYPAADEMRLACAVADIVHAGVPRGEGLRRVGWSAFDAVLQSRLGQITFGVFAGDVERLLTHGRRAFALVHSFGELSGEEVAPGLYLFRRTGFPVFLETVQVGVLEAALRHAGAHGHVRVLLEGLAHATYEIAFS